MIPTLEILEDVTMMRRSADHQLTELRANAGAAAMCAREALENIELTGEMTSFERAWITDAVRFARKARQNAEWFANYYAFHLRQGPGGFGGR